MHIEFPYQYISIPKFGKVFYPSIPLSLKTIETGTVEFEFLVDTGADLTTLPFHMAERLGINLKKCRRSRAGGIGGHSVKTWETAIQIGMGSNWIPISATVTEDDETPMLLGRIDILDTRFSLYFDSQKKKIVFED